MSGLVDVNDDLLCLRLKNSSKFEATDQRDFVYGIIGMTDTHTGPPP